MKGWYLFVLSIGLFSNILHAGSDTWRARPIIPAQVETGKEIPKVVPPKLFVEEVRMEVSKEAPIHTFDITYEVDSSNTTFTLISNNYAIDKLGFKLISQKSGLVTPNIKTINEKKIKLDLSREPKGTYYLRLCQKSGEIVKIYRLILAQ